LVLTVTSPTESSKERELPDLGEPDQEGDRPSVTDVNGTVARFEMSYSPPSISERRKFGVPLRQRIPSLMYVAIAAVIVGLVIWGYNAPSTSRIFVWVVEGDRTRPFSSQVLAIVVAVCALGTLLAGQMRGVVISQDWIEARYLLPLGIPKNARWGWPQVNRLIFDKTSIAVELMDGSWERLPEVARLRELRELMLAHAAKRRIDVTELDRA
jgi:hypothetical protein